MTAEGQARKHRLARFIREVWDEGSEAAAERYVAPAYTIHHDPGDPWEGRVLDPAGYKERLRLLRAPFPDQHFDNQGLYADGDTVVMTWLWEATHRGPVADFPATGQRVRMSGATAYTFDADDRLTGHWQITDRLGVYQQFLRNRSG
jgi:predicted ester cyclase